MGKVICMSRCSTLVQELESQTINLKEEAKRLGYSDQNIILIEDHESGINLDFEEREGINKLIETINNENIDRIIIYEISRLARRADVFYKVRDILLKKKIQLDVLTPRFSMLNDDGTINENSNLLIGLFLSMAESEMRIKKSRFARGKEIKKKQGKFVGGRILFGYSVDKEKNFIIDPIKSQVVKEIFSRYIKDKISARQLSRQLYQEGKIKSDGKSGETFVCKILKNPAYYDGKLYEPIISKDEFEKAGSLIESHFIRPKRAYSESVYLGHKLLFGLNTGRQFLVRKSDAAYVEPIEGFCININFIDSLLLYLADKSMKRHSDTDRQNLLVKYEEEMKQVLARLDNYDKEEKKIKDQIDRLESRIILGSLSQEKAEQLEKTILKNQEILHVSRQKDLSLRNILEENLRAIVSPYNAKFDIYTVSPVEQQKVIREEIDRILVNRVKNGTYHINVTYKNPLLDSEIYVIKSKQHKVTLYGEEIEIKLIKRFKRGGLN